jgi:protein-tyrosine phosphatase
LELFLRFKCALWSERQMEQHFVFLNYQVLRNQAIKSLAPPALPSPGLSLIVPHVTISSRFLSCAPGFFKRSVTMFDKQRVVFVCTGNIYRSRFAEALFNFHARALGLDWFASSRGLRIHIVDSDLAPQTRDALLERNIPLHGTGAEPASLTDHDLAHASMTIAMKEAEHLPMMLESFPQWAGRIDYWNIHDVEDQSPEMALPQIEDNVVRLLQTLRESQALAHFASPASES